MAFLQLTDGIGQYDVSVNVHDLSADAIIAQAPIARVTFPDRHTKVNLMIPVPPLPQRWTVHIWSRASAGQSQGGSPRPVMRLWGRQRLAGVHDHGRLRLVLRDELDGVNRLAGRVDDVLPPPRILVDGAPNAVGKFHVGNVLVHGDFPRSCLRPALAVVDSIPCQPARNDAGGTWPRRHPKPLWTVGRVFISSSVR
jgi:hypothetical protein